MTDAIFANPRLAAVYDSFDGNRDDLVHYLNIAQELDAQSVLDVGCGTGEFACLLASHGFDVVGVDPAEASLNIARKKEHASSVSWILGYVCDLQKFKFDLAVMTGNVAQVFLGDQAWFETLVHTYKILKPGGYFVFETRDPSKKDWENWTRKETYNRLKIPEIGYVESWCDVVDVSENLVTFIWSYYFEADQKALTSR